MHTKVACTSCSMRETLSKTTTLAIFYKYSEFCRIKNAFCKLCSFCFSGIATAIYSECYLHHSQKTNKYTAKKHRRQAQQDKRDILFGDRVPGN